MKFGYTICYVDDVHDAVAFYTTAFGLATKLVSDEDGLAYAELKTGEVTLAFANHALAASSLGDDEAARKPPGGFEIAFVTDDVAAGVEKALAAGATLLAEPVEKPWGQTVAYVRDPDGILIELCTPMPEA